MFLFSFYVFIYSQDQHSFPTRRSSDLEETEFFAEGDFAGTPYRTLPARKKPLIKLGSDYFAVDPCFTRDAGYRALLFNLDRKSTRLNSSHVAISYAVFCLKKKK